MQNHFELGLNGKSESDVLGQLDFGVGFLLIAFITWPVLVIQLGKCKPLYQGF